MARIKHIAISTQDVDATAKFYIDAFGLKEVGKVNSPNASGYYLTDGYLNIAILNFKNDQAAGAERGKGWSGIHHVGFQVEDVLASARGVMHGADGQLDGLLGQVNHLLRRDLLHMPQVRCVGGTEELVRCPFPPPVEGELKATKEVLAG